MGHFTVDWLSLREPVDGSARNRELTRELMRWRVRYQTLSVIDLGAGTGANLRFLAPRLKGHQRWLLLEHDPALLAHVEPCTVGWAQTSGLELIKKDNALVIYGGEEDYYGLESRQFDLVVDLDRLRLDNADLVSAAALLDLVSRDWLDALARRCFAAGTAIFMALIYNGKISWNPMDDDDPFLVERVNRHQQTDKGFGAALGPSAAAYLAAALERLGYRVRLKRSDWHLGAREARLQVALLHDYAKAARQREPDAAPQIEAWLRRRLDALATSQLTVGHVDIFAHL